MIGRFLRKLRIDNDEILKDMADKLDVTASFLSAVENGKKHMPSDWNGKICELYSLNTEQQQNFTTAIAETEESISMNLNGVPDENRKLAISFARQFSDFNEDQIDKIRHILQGG